MSTFCYDHADIFNGKRVIELGAGIGNVSILIDKLKRAETVLATDGDDDTIELLRANVERVNSHVIVRKLSWGQQDDFKAEFPEGFDLIVAADVVYEDEQVEPLLEAVTDLLHADGIFLLAYARRNIPIDRVLEVAVTRGLVWSVVDDGDGLEPIYKFAWKQP